MKPLTTEVRSDEVVSSESGFDVWLQHITTPETDLTGNGHQRIACVTEVSATVGGGRHISDRRGSSCEYLPKNAGIPSIRVVPNE